ncbi:LysR family transcriptional regulator [Thalassospira aquimaris]|uniref:LysR family transcriptional regulator n=1 Tax=Thalassospira aquimaris TaxID=3037796 RepID=A0ABT6GBM9_9PROT|nr:LysR family transcriptional regulator [Thalassospira sp. FZY0004]MDG4719424.1 LysR family transcriptional regulator [Thalassospira sp. FZY0004]
MKRINLDPDEIRSFCLLAETGSFRKVAQRLGISGSTLSRQINRIEERTQARLFDRDTRNVALTDQGKMFLRLAERILNTTESALAEFDTYLNTRRGKLTIAGLPSVTAGLLPPLIAEFMATHPDVDLQLNDMLSDGVLREVEMGRADIGFTADVVENSDNLSFQRLLSDRFIAVGAPDSFLQEQRTYQWEEILAQPMVAMSRETSVRAVIDAACTQNNFLFRPRFEVAHLATAGALVSQGLCITALPSLTLPVLGRSPLIFRPLESPVLLRQIGLVWRSGRTLSPAAQAFLALVRNRNLKSLIPHSTIENTIASPTS